MEKERKWRSRRKGWRRIEKEEEGMRRVEKEEEGMEKEEDDEVQETEMEKERR